jgi:hypothetical protein
MGLVAELPVAVAEQSATGLAKPLMTNAHRAFSLAAWRVAPGPMKKTT